MPTSASMTTLLIIKFTELVIKLLCTDGCKQAGIKPLLLLVPFSSPNSMQNIQGQVQRLLRDSVLNTCNKDDQQKQNCYRPASRPWKAGAPHAAFWGVLVVTFRTREHFLENFFIAVNCSYGQDDLSGGRWFGFSCAHDEPQFLASFISFQFGFTFWFTKGHLQYAGSHPACSSRSRSYVKSVSR